PQQRSAISSSSRVMTGRSEVSCNDGTFAVGAVAEAPPAIIKDAPAAPNAGKAILRCFRFEARFACAIVGSSDACEQISRYYTWTYDLIKPSAMYFLRKHFLDWHVCFYP